MVGSYRLERRLGSGAMGEVWLGRHVLTGGIGAVKLLRAGGRNPDRLRQFFAREGRAVARLRHPHIVGVFEVGAEYLVTAFIDGTDLARRLHTPIDPALALRLTRQIASALVHAHEAGVVHRDIKPSNILVDKQQNAFLADFGLALLADEVSADGSARAGTPAFMAPEQAKGGPIGPAADQYALGRTLLEMLVGGRLPIDPAEALAQLPASMPAPLRATIQRATAAAPGERFASMAAFDAALAELDLAAYAAPVRLAPEVRLRAPYGWCTGAHRTAMLAPDLMRADYRLSDLVRDGLVPREATLTLQASSGFSEIGWSVYGCSTRLGPMSEPGAFARATEVVVLMHGWAATREVWRTVATAICRDNAQALVLTPDIYGSGETRWASPRPAAERLTAKAIIPAIQAWQKLLRLDDFPTVLVGHSLSAVAVLSVNDDTIGTRTSRIAINPVFPQHNSEYRKRIQKGIVLMRTIGRVGALRPWFTRKMMLSSPASAELAPAVLEDFVANVLGLPAPALPVMFRALLDTPRFEGDLQQRLLLVLGANDPLISESALAASIADLDLHPAQVVRLATGGHYPHLETASNPEWTARNAAEMVSLVGTMMLSSREGTLLSTHLESTVMGDTTEGGAHVVSTSAQASAAGSATVTDEGAVGAAKLPSPASSIGEP